MNEYRPAKKRITVSVGESVRIIRELQELSQNQLSALTGIPQATISAIENDRVRLGVERAKILARALKVHPGVLVFPGWELPDEVAAYRDREKPHSSPLPHHAAYGSVLRDSADQASSAPGERKSK